MTGHHDIDTSDDGPLPRARALMLLDMSEFIEWVEANPAARRAVIDAPDTHSGIEAWRDFFNSGRDVCLAIQARHAAEDALL